ncbi:NAD(P)-binding domain-containing protein [Microbacterium sp. P02]|uniref:NAD(P)-dependent oxidoreductase n=1 Tax=Microbacterium sp. P02 TaxID=3366260 RepID=UPI00366B332C
MRVAVLGLGEAGSIYSADLAARGASVAGVDPRAVATPVGVTRAADIATAVQAADIVLSLVGGTSSRGALAEALPAMSPEAIYADMNTSHPDTKRALADAASARGVAFVDIAILAPVPRARIGTALLLSGPGAGALLPTLRGLGLPADDAGPEPGTAAGLKLLRSVFMKGLAAVVFESAEAAEVVGARDWVIDQMASELGPSGRELVERMIEGTRLHAVRREDEMRDVRAYLQSLDATHAMTDGTIEWLRRIAAEEERSDAAASDPRSA